tara:strand:- start:92 stop:310 length:219 start_codon:yes stop_codon:yes gene_type:complete
MVFNSGFLIIGALFFVLTMEPVAHLPNTIDKAKIPVDFKNVLLSIIWVWHLGPINFKNDWIQVHKFVVMAMH